MVSISVAFVIYKHDLKGSIIAGSFLSEAHLRVFTTMLIILCIAWIYLLILLYDTLATKNIYQALALPLYAIVVVVLLVVQVERLKDPNLWGGEKSRAALMACWRSVKWILLANPIVTGILVSAQTILAWKLRKYFGGAIFEHLDADVTLHKRFRWVQVSDQS